MEFWQNKSLENLECYRNGELLNEYWKDIIGFDGVYQISSFGRVRNTQKNRMHGQRLKQSGVIKGRRKLPYCETALSKSGKSKFFSVHRLALIAFKGMPPTPKHIGMHQNDIPYDNLISNLRWGTYQENVIDCVTKGRNQVDINQMKRMSAIKRKNQVNVIITNPENGERFEAGSLREASRLTGVTFYSVKKIILNKSKRRKKFIFEIAN